MKFWSRNNLDQLDRLTPWDIYYVVNISLICKYNAQRTSIYYYTTLHSLSFIATAGSETKHWACLHKSAVLSVYAAVHESWKSDEMTTGQKSGHCVEEPAVSNKRWSWLQFNHYTLLLSDTKQHKVFLSMRSPCPRNTLVISHSP